jgi:serine/threonine protein kinase
LLGTGTFGQVFKCQKDGTKQQVAIKIIKNQTAYYNQGLLEIKIARLLNNTFDPNDEHHLVRLIDYFEFKNHICVVFELLSMSLLDILTQNQFRGLPLPIVQRFTRQILSALVTLEEAKIIHCDLKPENIYVKQNGDIQLLDIDSCRKINDLRNEGNTSTRGYCIIKNGGRCEDPMARAYHRPAANIYSLSKVNEEIDNWKLKNIAGGSRKTRHRKNVTRKPRRRQSRTTR